MRQKLVFAFTIVSMVSILISPVALASPSGPFSTFLPMVSLGSSNQDNPTLEVSTDVHHDTSTPLTQMAAAMLKSRP